MEGDLVFPFFLAFVGEYLGNEIVFRIQNCIQNLKSYLEFKKIFGRGSVGGF